MISHISKRLNWIDWAKTIAITMVVYGHIPQERGSFPLNYIVLFHMPLFFFISGYLTKKEFFCTDTIKKYWRTLVIPYLFFNLIFYPYWVFRYIINTTNLEWYVLLKPIIGTILLQHETSYYESLNGVTWFIAALLVMKVILSICNNYKNGNKLYIALVIASAFFYIFNEFCKFVTDLPPVGFVKCLPFFYLGYFCKTKNYLPQIHQKKDWLGFIFFTGLSLIAYKYIKALYSPICFGITFWTICLTAIWGFFCLCRILDHVHNSIIFNISIGTIVILGMHWMLIGTTNFIISKMFLQGTDVVYSWYTAIILAILFVGILYPVIIIIKKKMPYLLGKTKI